MTVPKVPRAPRRPLTFCDEDFVEWDRPLFRIHRIVGTHAAAWDEFRLFGPLDFCRWDHQPEPKATAPGYGVLYAASDPRTALAEVFQQHRLIRLSEQQMLTGWQATRPLRLLNITGAWALRNGAGRALAHAPRTTTRAWARAIYAQGPADLDGLISDSTLTGGNSRVLVLWENARDSFPEAPALAMQLSNPALSGIIADAAIATGYRIG